MHMHGALLKSRCAECEAVRYWPRPLSRETISSACGQDGGMRPLIVWFGELPFFMYEIGKALEQADLFVAIGTSGVVYPAAGFVRTATQYGADTIEINNVGTDVSHHFTRHMIGPATEMVPKLVGEILGG